MKRAGWCSSGGCRNKGCWAAGFNGAVQQAVRKQVGNMNEVLSQIQNVIDSRKGTEPESSYVAQLLHKGEDKILKKVIEEAGEVLMASKDGGGEHLIYEAADLWFHTMVLLAHHGLRVEAVVAELARRQGLSGLAEKAARQEG